MNPHTGDWSHWNSLMENYVPPDIRLKLRKLLIFILSVVSPTNYGNILIPNVSSIRTDFLVDSCVRCSITYPDSISVTLSQILSDRIV